MLDEEIYQKIVETFKEELQEQYQILSDGLLRLETIESLDENFDSILALLFRASHNIKGAAKSVSFDKVAEIAHKLEDNFSQWRDNKIKPAREQIDICLQQIDDMLEYAKTYRFDQSDNQHDIAVNESIKVPLQRINMANAKMDEFLTFRLQLEDIVAMTDHYSLNNSVIITFLSSLKDKINQKNTEFTLEEQVGLDRILKSILNGETYFNIIKSNLNSLQKEYSRCLTQFQSHLREMRLVPIAMSLEPLRRSARDIAQSIQKDVKVKIEGGDIEIDKSVIDLLSDPLTHLLRNSICHGIENKEDRLQAKKSEYGNITIKAEHKSGMIIISFIDDGNGIDPKRIKQAALDKGIIDSATLNKMSPKEILDIVFWSGFSTQNEISELAGRGVGLDAVRSNIESVKGSIHVKSEVGKGTIFTLSLPLTLATERGLFVRVGHASYVIPSSSSVGIFEISPNDIVSVNNDKVYILNNKPIPVRDLSKVLGLNELMDDNSSRNFAVHLRNGSDSVIILVDEIISEHECVVKPLGYPLHSVLNISGASFTAKGELLLVLNSYELIHTALTSHGCTPKFTADAIHDDNEVTAIVRKKVLVVDDSITTRSLESNALESVGYSVDTAVDGEDAWKKLISSHYDIVISDVEMPKLNGLELTKRIKSDEKLKNLPIIIVTSNKSDVIRNDSFKSGASGFLVKSQFDTTSLIEMIEKFI